MIFAWRYVLALLPRWLLHLFGWTKMEVPRPDQRARIDTPQRFAHPHSQGPRTYRE